jgi:hypothetical protein
MPRLVIFLQSDASVLKSTRRLLDAHDIKTHLAFTSDMKAALEMLEENPNAVVCFGSKLNNSLRDGVEFVRQARKVSDKALLINYSAEPQEDDGADAHWYKLSGKVGEVVPYLQRDDSTVEGLKLHFPKMIT